jgi:acyl carrier protein
MTTSQQSTTDTVRRLVDQQLNFTAHAYDLGPDDDLWRLGMTSLTCLGLMLAVEDTLGIEFPEDALKQSTFRTVNTITAAVDGARDRSDRRRQENAVRRDQ